MDKLARKRERADLTHGSLFKKIFLFSLPLMLSNLLQVLFNLSDVAVVGRFAGERALGSVGSTSVYVMLFTGFLIGIGSGVNSLVAQKLGSGEHDEVSKAVHTAAIVCVITGFIIMGMGIGLARPLLLLLRTKPELIDGAILYITIYFLGSPAMALYNFGNGVFSADGNTAKPLIFLGISGVVNIALNLFFVIVCKMSVAGVALASVISQYLSAVLVVTALFISKRPYKLSLKKLRPDKVMAKRVLVLGVPAGVQNAVFQAANLFIQAGVNSFDTVMVEGNAAAANSDALVYDVMAAFYTACTSFIGQNYGAGKRDRILKSYFISTLYAFVFGLIIGVLLVVFGEAFLSLFTTEQAVVDAGMKRLTIMGYSYAVSAFMDGAIAAARGLNKTVIPTIIVIMGSCVFRIIWVYTVFAYFKTIPSLYLLYVFSWVITAVAEIAYLIFAYRKSMKNLPPEPVIEEPISEQTSAE